MIYEGALGFENSIPGLMGFENGTATCTALELCLGSKAYIRTAKRLAINSIEDRLCWSFRRF